MTSTATNRATDSCVSSQRAGETRYGGSGDFLARLGGDEFGLLAPNTDETGMDLMSQRLREVSPDGISCSYGVATWDGYETVTDFFRRADDALYEAKRQ